MFDAPQKQGGRPRKFDVDEALDKAMLIFWEQGYDGTSLVGLTTAMGVSKPSLYAAFGNKKALFEAALTRYAEGPNAFIERAFTLQSAKQVVAALLEGAVNISTLASGPRGCMNTQAALTCAEEVRDFAADRRVSAELRLEERFRKAKEARELPSDTDCAALTRYFTSVAFGITVLGASGASRLEVKAVADLAMQVWPGRD